MMWSDLRYRLRAVFRRATVERELDDELRFHIEREADKYVAQGVPRDEAVRRARLAFGGVSRIKDDTRDARGVTFLEHVMQDVRYALRGLRTRPLFTAVVVTTLALGVGVNAAMFGILDRTLVRSPAYLVDPSSVNRVYVAFTHDARRGWESGLSWRTYQDLRRWSRATSEQAAFAYRRMAIGEGENTQEAVAAAVTATYFDFFTAKPVVGRFFSASEDTPPAGDAVAVVSYGFWQSRYAGRPDVLGSMLKVGKGSYRIIGVAPASFEGVSDDRAPAVFVPITAFATTVAKDYADNYGWTWLEVLVRRRPDVSVDQATADLSNAYAQSYIAERVLEPGNEPPDVAHPAALAGPLPRGRGPLAGPESRVIPWIAGVAFIVLLIACANVANLLLARALRRRREMAVRRAMGGTRARLVQQLFTEMVVLAVFGSIAGLFGAQLAAGSMRKLLVGTSDSWPVVTDGRTVLFAIGLTLLTALLAGLLPALSASRGDLAGSLKAGTREGTYRQSRLRTTLLVFQTALSVVLLVGAGLFVRSLRAVESLPKGYDVDRLVYVEGSMRGTRMTSVEERALMSDLVAAARAMPGVVNATPTASVPFYSSEGRGMWVEGIDSVRKLGRFQLQSGSPDYFATLGTRIIRGRPYTAEDRATTTPVAVVSLGMAKKVWKTDDPIGKCFRIGSKDSPCITVVGVAENMKARDITGDDEMAYYLPMEQYLARFEHPPMLALFVRVQGRPEEYTESMRLGFQRLMPGSSYITTRPFHLIVDPTMRSWTSGARMFVTFGALALALAAIGLYAVIAFGVAQRTQELGVRIALGARGNDILRLVVGEGVRVTIGGVVLGGLIAAAASRAIAGLLFDVSPRDPLVFAIVAVTLIVVGILASAIPAARATRVDPSVALRTE